MIKDVEIWVVIPFYEEYYKVSNWGRVWSLRQDRLMSLCLNRGYIKVGLRKDRKTKTVSVHRLVGLLFLDNVDNKPEINHKDFDKSNNYYKNLAWVTGYENRAHYSLHHGVKDKVVIQSCKCGNLKVEYRSIAEAGRVLKISPKSISACLHGFSNTSGGYYWDFKKIL